jgi:hypothetical protein
MSDSFLLLLFSVGESVNVPERPPVNNWLRVENYLRKLKIGLLVLNHSRLFFRSLFLSRIFIKFGRGQAFFFRIIFFFLFVGGDRISRRLGRTRVLSVVREGFIALGLGGISVLLHCLGN